MPLIVNGIAGTNYFGKTNFQQRIGICESCGSNVILSSYDTKLFFFFIAPLIPLGKKRIIDYCSHCKRHKILPLKKYNKLHLESLEKNLGQYQQDPSNSECVHNLLATCIFYWEVELFYEIVPAIQQRHNSNVDVIIHLGAAYHHFRDYDNALKVYMAGLSVTKDQRFNGPVADTYLKMQKPELAEPFIMKTAEYRLQQEAENVSDKDVEQNTDIREMLIYELITGYQYVGNHERVLVLINQVDIEKINDKNLKKSYNKALKFSQANQHTNKPTVSERMKLLEYIEKKKNPSNIGNYWAAFAGPAFVCILLAIYMIVSLNKAKNPEIYMLNGLDRSYKVSVNGIEKVLPPLRQLRINVPEGQINIEVLDKSLYIDPQTINIESNFFSRPFSSRFFIINPDRIAPIEWEKIYYAGPTVKEKDIPEGEWEFYTGKNLYEFSGIDYKFSEFPKETDIYSKIESKTRLGIFNDPSIGIEDIVQFLLDEEDSDLAFEYARRHLYYNPDDVAYLTYLNLCCIGNKEKYINALEPGLAIRPVRVELHRSYQKALASSGIDDSIIYEKYQAMLNSEPDNNDLLYLLARITPDPQKSEKLALRSVQGLNPCRRAYYSLAFIHLCKGQFDMAKDYIERVDESMVDNNFLVVKYNIYNALQDYDYVLDEIDKQLAIDPNQPLLFTTQALYYQRKGQHDNVRKSIDKWFELLDNDVLDNQRKQLRIDWLARVAYWNKDMEKYENLSGQLSDYRWKFERCISCSRGIPDDVDEKIIGAYNLLVAYVAYMNQGDIKLADKYLKRAVKQLSSAEWSEKYLSETLSQTIEPDIDLLCGLHILPEGKRIALTACGYIYPEHKDRLFALARKLNYDPSFPHILIDKITKNK